MAGELTVRFQQGDVVVQLQGDADAVQAELADLKTHGLGKLGEFFGPVQLSTGSGAGPGAGSGTGPGSGGGGGQLGGGTGPTAPLTNPAASFRFGVTSFLLPTDRTQYAFDLTGDGKPDNALSNFFGALMGQEMDLQGVIDGQVQTGHLVLLLTLETELTTPAVDQRACATLFAGKAIKPSQGVYVIDTSVAPVTVQGRIVAGRFASDDPRTGGAVVERDLTIPLSPGVSVTLSVQGLRLAFNVASNGSTISAGQLTGSVKATDVQTGFVPAIAAAFTEMIQSQSSVAMPLSQLFDTGGCTNPDGSTAQAGDGVIDVCEILANPMMSHLLQPDVQIWDGQGNYAPSPAGGVKDSMSIGIGLAGSAATY